MRSFNPVFLNNHPKVPAQSARDYVSTFLEGITITPHSISGCNANVGENESVSILYVPEQYFPDNIQVNSFLIEVFDHYQTHYILGRAPLGALHISENKARIMLGRAARSENVMALHRSVVEAAQKLAHAFMALLNVKPTYRLSNMNVGQTFAILVYAKK